MAEKTKPSKQKKEITKRRRIIIFTLIALAAIFIFFLGFEGFLRIRLWIGNDVVITLNSNKTDLFLKNNQTDILNFQVGMVESLFCTAKCNYSFENLGEGKIMDKGEFNLKSSLPLTKEYSLIAGKQGVGQEIYRFNLECNGIATLSCHTKENKIMKSILVTLNYNLNDEEQKIKENSKQNISKAINEMAFFSAELANLYSAIENINNSYEFQLIKADIANLTIDINSLNETFYSLKDKWENQDYNSLNIELEKVKNLENINSRFESINNSLAKNILIYNPLVEQLSELRNSLVELKQANVSNATSDEINQAIIEFNSAVSSFNNKDYLKNKHILAENLTEMISQINISSDLKCCFANQDLSDFNLTQIKINQTVKTELIVSFKEPKEMCCLSGKCQECCNETCKDNKALYPIIFVHGHDFNKDVSAEASLNVFSNIQKQLEKEGYLNAGSLLISDINNESNGIYQGINEPLTFKSSYYFDILKTKQSSQLILTKTDSIDTYALRLNEIVKLTKYKTGKDKVVLMGHSMGGLVVRRYLQLFGSESVDKVILTGTPNHGIDGRVSSYCPIFGGKLECKDMTQDSLFLTKLNNGENPGIPIYNIIGIGCTMDNETGDGILKSSSALLDYADNYFVTGTCDEIKLRFFHTFLLDTEAYPQIFDLIKEFLRK